MPTDPNNYTGIASPAGADGKRELKSLAEEPVWEESIYQIQPGDLLAGGEKGLANLQAQQLANRTAWLKKNAGNNKRIKDLENMMMEFYAAKEAKSKAPSWYSGIMAEAFIGGADEIDKTEVSVTSVGSKGTYVDVLDSYGIAIGSTYQFVDLYHTEEVRVKTISRMSEGFRVSFEEPLASHVGKAKLCRTTTVIENGHATDGKVKRKPATSEKQVFTGTTVRASADFTDYKSFTLTGAKVQEDGSLKIGGLAYGVVLNATGNTYGDWRRINVDGNDLTQADLQ